MCIRDRIIVGDIKHSRVARSNIKAFTAMGAEVTLVAPRTLLPEDTSAWPVAITPDLDTALSEADVVYMLRMQLERQREAFVPSLREYATDFGLTLERAGRLKENAIIMHPGPMNRGIEIASDVPELPNALVTNQVANGVIVRMAVLYHLLGTGVDLIEEGEEHG